MRDACDLGLVQHDARCTHHAALANAILWLDSPLRRAWLPVGESTEHRAFGREFQVRGRGQWATSGISFGLERVPPGRVNATGGCTRWRAVW
jgi:hypothetical protein